MMFSWITASPICLGCIDFSNELQKGRNLVRFECGWPAFSFSYPEDWKVALKSIEGQVYRVEADGGFPNAAAWVRANMPASVKSFSQSVLPALSEHGSDFDIVRDNAVTLMDGTHAWETQLNWILNTAKAITTHFVTVKKNELSITVSVASEKGKMDDDLKAIAYSLQVDPREQNAVTLPDDVAQFLNEVANAITARDLDKVLSYYSDHYLCSGKDKTAIKAFYQKVLNLIPDFKFVLTRFEMQNDIAVIAGYMEVMGSKYPIASETLRQGKDGRWEYYGDQNK